MTLGRGTLIVVLFGWLFLLLGSVHAAETGVGYAEGSDPIVAGDQETEQQASSDSTLIDAWLELLEEVGLESGDSETE